MLRIFLLNVWDWNLEAMNMKLLNPMIELKLEKWSGGDVYIHFAVTKLIPCGCG